jgi:hypothetical protein
MIMETKEKPKGWKMKPDIINLCEMWIGQSKWYPITMLLKTVKWTKGFMLFLLQMTALKIRHRPKSKGQGLWLQELHTWLYSENDRSSTKAMTSLASTPTALTTPPCRWWLVANPDECQQGTLNSKNSSYYTQ